MSDAEISQVFYRSSTRRAMSIVDLRALARHARERNAAASVTGLLVYHERRFTQWFEGPETAVAKLWASICRDPRHHAIEQLHAGFVTRRLFPDWRMQLGLADSGGLDQAVTLSAESIRDLAGDSRVATDAVRDVAFSGSLPQPHAMATLLARGTDREIDQFVQHIAAGQPSWRSIGVHVLTPIARSLGNSWTADRLSGVDLAIAQARLQALLRGARPVMSEARRPVGQALVAPMPGESDVSSSTFASIALDSAGWQVSCVFPRTAEELVEHVSGQPLDVLHVALSDAFSREHRMAELAALIRAARSASPNPRLRVRVSGRAFFEQQGLATLIGADDDARIPPWNPGDFKSASSSALTRSAEHACAVARETLRDVCELIRRRRFRADAAPTPVHGA